LTYLWNDLYQTIIYDIDALYLISPSDLIELFSQILTIISCVKSLSNAHYCIQAFKKVFCAPDIPGYSTEFGHTGYAANTLPIRIHTGS